MLKKTKGRFKRTSGRASSWREYGREIAGRIKSKECTGQKKKQFDALFLVWRCKKKHEHKRGVNAFFFFASPYFTVFISGLDTVKDGLKFGFEELFLKNISSLPSLRRIQRSKKGWVKGGGSDRLVQHFRYLLT